MSIREYIQNKLDEITDITITTELPDEVLEDGKVYFSYTIQVSNIKTDLDGLQTNRVNIVGYLKIKDSPDLDTLDEIDKATKKICDKLKEINFSTNYLDISLNDTIRKTRVSGNSIYNEINNGFIK